MSSSPKYKVLMLMGINHLEVYLDNEFAIGLSFDSGIFEINLVFLKINIF